MDRDSHGFALCAAITVQFILLPFDIASLILSKEAQKGDGDDICDNKDDGTGLDVAHYLFYKGLFGIVFSVCIGYGVYVFFTNDSDGWNFREGGTMTLCSGYLIFYVIWWIIGGVVLFRSNIECIKEGTDHVIYCLVTWGIFLLVTLVVCCGRG